MKMVCDVAMPTTPPLTPVDFLVRASEVYGDKNKMATEETFAGRWFHMGGLDVLTADGYVKLKNRSKDVIISSGKTFQASKIEDALVRLLHSDPAWNARPRKSLRTAARSRLRSRFPRPCTSVSYPRPRQANFENLHCVSN